MVAPKDQKQKPEKLKNNPAEFTTCENCDTRRKLPEGCKCKRQEVFGE